MRLSFPEEARFSWLGMLLDAYEIIDTGVAIAIKKEEESRKVKLACKKGCNNCCGHKDIPIYPLEMVSVYWYSTEKILEPMRKTLKSQILGHNRQNPCPFLIEGSCSIYLIRPVSCRLFNVFGKPCDDGEDPYHTRRNDVLTPIEDYTNQAIFAMLPFYGITDEADRIMALEDGLIHTQAQNLQSYDWKNLLKVMNDLDSKNTLKASF